MKEKDAADEFEIFFDNHSKYIKMKYYLKIRWSEERRKVCFFVQRSELFLKVDCFVPENFAQLLLYSLVDQRFSPFVYAYLILIFYQTFYSILKLALLLLRKRVSPYLLADNCVWEWWGLCSLFFENFVSLEGVHFQPSLFYLVKILSEFGSILQVESRF